MGEGKKAGQDGDDTDAKPVKRIWAHDVQVGAAALEVRLDALAARADLTRQDQAIVDGVRSRLEAAYAATIKKDPIPGRISNWWRGTLVEASFQNLHAAEALIVSLYPPEVVDAEIPEAVARVEAMIDRDDPRRQSTQRLLTGQGTPTARREQLRKAMEVGLGAADAEHTRLRSFRNAVVGATVVLTVVLLAFILFVALYPSAVSFCFSPKRNELMCPSGGDGPRWQDVVVIAILGVLGGLLSGIVSIRNMDGTSIAYDVPQALAWLKPPLGALSALGGLLVVRGEFVPGLTALDTSDQVLAYAFAFGVAQQLLVGLVDKQAQSLLADAPGKGSAASRPERGAGQVADRPSDPPPDGRRSRRTSEAEGKRGGRVRRALRELRLPDQRE